MKCKNTASLVVGMVIVLLAGAAFGPGGAPAAQAADYYAWTALAGLSGGIGSANGTGSAARFNAPDGVAVDATGNLYVADTDNHTIRKVTPAGEVTTLAGLAGTLGSADGTGSAARFRFPSGVAVDGAGNIYVADMGNHTIRKVTPAGEVTTLAGLAGAQGSTDGTGGAARFDSPHGVAVDGAGNLYVADTRNYAIRKITPAGEVTTLAGLAGTLGSADGTGSAARFRFPYGVAADGAGNIYVADTENHTIRKVTPAGEVTTLAGLAGTLGSADGTGSAARFSYPYGVAADQAGNVYVASTSNHTIRRITPAGEVTTLAGLAGSWGSIDGTGSAARFSYPYGVAVDGAGHIYVADTENHTIRKVTPAGEATTLAGAPDGGYADGTGGEARFNSPFGVAVDGAGNVYVADTENHTIRKVTPAGAVTPLAGQAGSPGSADGMGAAATFNSPIGVAVDGAGNVYVADTENHTIRKVTPAGEVTTLAGQAGSSGSADGTGSAARFNYPYGVAVDAAGHIYVADTVNHTIRKVTPAGEVTTLAGQAGADGRADGVGSAARFNRPAGLAIDGAGHIYVADSQNYTIRKVTPEGEVTTLAGQAGSPGWADGTGGAVRFYYPYGVAVDGAGNVYVADTLNDAIRKVTQAGEVTTVMWLPGSLSSSDTNNVARFDYPFGVAIDGMGNLYISDSDYHRICVGVPGYLAPQITRHPASLSAAEGGTVTFTVAAAGSGPLTYQWQKDGVDLVDDAHYDGATTDSLTITDATAAEAGQYRCVATCVSSSAISDPAVLTVTLGTGTLTIETTPVPAEVFVDGVSWGTAPQSRTVTVGSYTVTFSSVAGYIPPAWQSAAVARDQTATVTGTYSPIPPDAGALAIDTAPVRGEVFVNGTSWGTAPQSRILAPGTYTVTFGEMAGYTAPDEQTVTVAKDQAATASGTYTWIEDDADPDVRGCGQGIGPFNAIVFYSLCGLSLCGLRLHRHRPPRR